MRGYTTDKKVTHQINVEQHLVVGCCSFSQSEELNINSMITFTKIRYV